MKLCARNVSAKGSITAHLRFGWPGGSVITASIIDEAVDGPGLRAGDQAYAVVKATVATVGRD